MKTQQELRQIADLHFYISRKGMFWDNDQLDALIEIGDWTHQDINALFDLVEAKFKAVLGLQP